MANGQKTSLVITNIVKFPLQSVVAAVTAGAVFPWQAVADWLVGFVQLLGA